MEILVFFRVDHPTLKNIVDSFEEGVSIGDLDKFEYKVTELGLSYGLGYSMCTRKSDTFLELSNDGRYLQRVYDSKKRDN